MIAIRDFIAAAEQIAAEEPSYRHGGYGQDGTCDCIGLIIGAIRRAGGQWRGLHGSNYAARKETVKVLPIFSEKDLAPGEVVYKSYAPGQGGYSLPARYEHGGDYYTGDLLDYFHIGIVVSVYPLRIRHMTSPRAKMDTSIGKWTYHGKLTKIDYAGGGGQTVETATISGGNTDKPVNLRKGPGTNTAIIGILAQGSTVDLLDYGAEWSQIRKDSLTGYVMTKFVHKSEDGGEKIQVNKAELEKIYDQIGDWLGLRG